MRLFIAVNLPDYTHEAFAGLREDLPGVHWVERESLHLTLKFLGELEAEDCDRIREVLNQVSVKSFLLPVEGVGHFPTRGQASVLWAGLRRGHPHLFHLHKWINDRLFGLGYEPDRRVFHPHITLAHCRDASREVVKGWEKRHAGFESAPFAVKELRLYSSKLLPGGPLYRVEGSWKLG